MNPIAPLYFNDHGISFFWKHDSGNYSSKIQLVFRETGFYFSKEELGEFTELMEQAGQRSNHACKGCRNRANCEKFLLKTPLVQIDLAVNKAELDGLKDLVNGTLFKLKLQRFVETEGRN